MGMNELEAAKIYRQTLLSARDGIRIDDWAIESRAVTPGCPVPWSIRKLALHGGKQEGVDLVILNNGRLEIRVVPTRGMGILDVRMGAFRLGWDSPVQQVVHPSFVDLASRGGLGWLAGFNEWMVRCGLESAGQPGLDRFVNNVGAEAEMELTLHGKIANIPAREVEILVSTTPPYTLRLRGRVDERMFYGPKLELWSEIAVDPGATEFTLSDRVSNRGAADQEFQLIYHTNFGPPLLEEGSRFVGAVDRVFPMNAHAATDLAAFETFRGPKVGFVEQVYCVTPLADSQGQTAMLLRNRPGDRGFLMRFSTRELPCFTLWKNTTALEEGYVTGFEPGTGFPFTRRIERGFGRVPKLGTGESRGFSIQCQLLEGASGVDAGVREIESIRAGRVAELIPEPTRLPEE